MNLALVTGTSSGIGLAVAKALLERGWQVVGVARRTPAINGAAYRHLALDLANVPAAAAALERELGPMLGERAWSRIGLVNNAAAAPAGRTQNMDAAELARTFALNAAMPLWLMGFVLRRKPAEAEARIVNVSSGAAVRASPGLAAYCASKAALRMAGMAVAAEDDVRVLSYSPGVVDTEMQLAARSKPLEDFPWGETFRRFHAEGMLVAPELPAREIVEFLESRAAERFAEGRRS